MAGELIGQQLGNYRLLQRLGEGGFAEVYLGAHIYLKTQAAIKVLHTRLGSEDLDSFVSEAQTIGHLNHPHIVRVLEFGVEESTPFLVMEYAPHGTLRQLHPKRSILAPASILPYVRQVAEALQYAHDQRFIHRDVKPENMLISECDEILLSDFGIATVAQSSRYQGTQEVAGTVTYMAPEQVQGKPRPASDQYSLGIVVYEWLSGTPPFQGAFAEIATQHVLTPPALLREKLPMLAPAIEEVVLTALAKDPKARFASVHAFATAFEHACQEAERYFVSTQVITPPAADARPTVILPPAAPLLSSPSARTFQTLPSDGPERTSIALPAKDVARPPRRRSRLLVLVSSLIFLLVLTAGGLAAVNLAPGFQNLFSLIGFQQHVTTGPDITSIQVGTGIDPRTGALQGATDTFHVGQTVYVVYTGPQNSQLVDFKVFQGQDLFYYGTGVVSQDGLHTYDWIQATVLGVDQWVIEYNGSPEASITFQVIP